MATPFTFEAPADSVPVGGENVSLALDRAGNPRIAFSQKGSGQIILARRDGGGTWTHENVPAGFVGDQSRLCLAIDSQGNPQLAYPDLSSGDLIHAVETAGQWSFTHIPTRLTPDHRPGGVGEVAFALDLGVVDPQERDVAFFVYTDLATDGIGFAHTGSIGPTPVTVQAGDQLTSFQFPSAALNERSGFFVGYIGFFHSGSPQELVSVRVTNLKDIEQGTFNAPFVIEGSQFINVRRPTSIAQTFFGHCLAYFDIANKTLKAHFPQGGAPGNIETVAANVNDIVTPSVAAQGNDFRVAYADGGIKLASRSPSDHIGVWTVEVVDPGGGESPSLAYDNSGTAHIAYAAGGKLKYGRRS